jgi:hypothetical protein
MYSINSGWPHTQSARLIESGPIPSVHGVVRWRLIGFDSMAPSSQLCAGGDGYEKSGLDLTTYEGVMKGTKFSRMVIAGDPESSNLMLLLDWRA